MANVTIAGGAKLNYVLSPVESELLKTAVGALSGPYSGNPGDINLIKAALQAPGTGTLDLYNFDDRKVPAFAAPEGADAVVFYGYGPYGVSITGSSTTKLLVGAEGNDTINAAGGSGTIIGGDGADLVLMNNPGQPGGSEYISVSYGDDTVRMWGGNATIAGATIGDRLEVLSGANNVIIDASMSVDIEGGTNTVHMGGGALTVAGGVNTVTIDGKSGSVDKTGGTLDLTLQSTQSTVPGTASFALNGDMTIHQTAPSNYALTLNGNDTIYLGAGNDTITQTGAGASTVYGGSGLLNYTGGSGADLVTLGSGKATVVGGGGADTIIGGSGLAVLDGSTGGDLLVGGSFSDTMVGGADGDLFRFSTVMGGGVHIIDDFTQGSDLIDLNGGGYTEADITQVSVEAGSTVIKLGDGTQITLKNFTGALGASDYTPFS